MSGKIKPKSKSKTPYELWQSAYDSEGSYHEHICSIVKRALSLGCYIQIGKGSMFQILLNGTQNRSEFIAYQNLISCIEEIEAKEKETREKEARITSLIEKLKVNLTDSEIDEIREYWESSSY